MKYYHERKVKASPARVTPAEDARPHYVYVLIDPRDNAVRYVGRSINPEKRLKMHIWEALTVDEHCIDRRVDAKRDWIRALHHIGLKPTLEIIATTNATEIADVERALIAEHCQAGQDLLNGQSTPFKGPTKLAAQQERRERKRAIFSYRAPSYIPDTATEPDTDQQQ